MADIPSEINTYHKNATVRARINNLSGLYKWITEQKSIQDFLTTASSASNSTYTIPLNSEKTETLHQIISIRKFKFGQSNPTYILDFPREKKQLVLRRKPAKIAHSSAHALHREYLLYNALGMYSNIPVPKVYAYCEDTSILGSEFYVMELIKGRIFVDPSMPHETNDFKTKAYIDALRVLSEIHTLDWKSIHSLKNYGKEGYYVKRQIKRLLQVSQKQAEKVGPVPGLNEVATKLERAIKYCPDNATLLHGDYKMDNLVFHPVLPKVIAVLDWELSTIGDPLCDLANFCMIIYMPSIEKGLGIAGLKGKPKEAIEGIPNIDQIMAIYYNYTSTAPTQIKALSSLFTIKSWYGFYIAFLCFKNSVIVHGVKQRLHSGVASSANAKIVVTLLPILIECAEQVLHDMPPPLLNEKSRL